MELYSEDLRQDKCESFKELIDVIKSCFMLSLFLDIYLFNSIKEHVFSPLVISVMTRGSSKDCLRLTETLKLFSGNDGVPFLMWQLIV